MNIQWNDSFPSSTKHSLYATIRRCFPGPLNSLSSDSLTSEALFAVLVGLKGMNSTWNDHPAALQQILLTGIEKVVLNSSVSTSDGKNIIKLMNHLIDLNVTRSEFSDDLEALFLEKLQKSSEKYDDQELLDILIG
jgi:hypothetical protein